MARVPRYARTLVVAASVLAIALVGCRSDTADTTADETTEPSPTAAVEAAGDFQLVGRSEQAFVGTGPETEASLRRSGDRPDTPQGFGNPPEEGVMRVVLETFTEELGDRCDADAGDAINVYWTRTTDFSPLLLRGSVEQTLEGRTVGVIGSLFRLPLAEDGSVDLGTTTSPSPQATPSVDERCVLVADQVGTERLRPRTTARPATPTPTVAATSTPAATPVATPEMSPATSPEASPEESP